MLSYRNIVFALSLILVSTASTEAFTNPFANNPFFQNTFHAFGQHAPPVPQQQQQQPGANPFVDLFESHRQKMENIRASLDRQFQEMNKAFEDLQKTHPVDQMQTLPASNIQHLPAGGDQTSTGLVDSPSGVPAPVTRTIVTNAVQADLQSSETNTEILIHGSVPGLDLTDIQIKFDQNMLTITGKRQLKSDTPGLSFSSSSSFSRSFGLPENVNMADAKATYLGDTLEIRIPKIVQDQPINLPIGNTDANAAPAQ